MKKFIAFTSIGLSVGFAIALANAQDTSTTPQGQPGTAETSSSEKTTTTKKDSSATSHPSDSETQTTTRTMESKVGQECTDDKGVKYHQGQKGYKECMQVTEKAESSS